MIRVVECLATGVLLAVLSVAPSFAKDADGGLCPEGLMETPNVSTPGCSLCSEPSNCEVVCTGIPPCLCEGSPSEVEECCSASPCCTGCPDADAPACYVLFCGCNPGECCNLVCANTMAPVADFPAMAVVALVLGLFGAIVLARRATSQR